MLRAARAWWRLRATCAAIVIAANATNATATIGETVTTTPVRVDSVTAVWIVTWISPATCCGASRDACSASRSRS